MIERSLTRRIIAGIMALQLAGAILAGGCSGTVKVEDPMAELLTTNVPTRNHRAAMAQLDADPANADYLRVLKAIIHQPGYVAETRREAFARLERHDLEGLKQTIQLRLPMMEALQWRRELCETIAKRGWTDLSPALARAWATPIVGWVDEETQRPEYLALAAMHGPENVIDEVFRIFVESNRVDQARLRARCWELLHRLGQRDRLIALVNSDDLPAGDLLLGDLRDGWRELGLLPSNYEEILWLRQLKQPENAAFWSRAAEAARSLGPEQKQGLELRMLPVIVSASLHEPQLLSMTTQELYSQVEQHIRREKKHAYTVNFDGFAGEYTQQLHEWRDKLPWGDLAALWMVTRALHVPQMTAHLFDYADRDMADKTTEYGGLIRLDDKDRFEIVEFQPRVKYHDNRFDAPQPMFDQGYTALFHFHNHTQKHDNESYAGPHLGDLNYADNTRANCLVFTFVDKNTLNADFYRHGRVIVDLGEIKRPNG